MNEKRATSSPAPDPPAAEGVLEGAARPLVLRGRLAQTRPRWLERLARHKRLIIIALTMAIFFALVSQPAPDGLTPEGLKALAIFLVCVIFWVTDVIPLMITGLLAVILFPLTGVLKANEAYALFGNQAVFFILGAFILASSFMRSGLSQRIALLVLKRCGKTPERLMGSLFLLSAVMSFWITAHAVAAMMFPIVTEIALALGLKPGRSRYGAGLFLAMAWGCIIGSVATFLGGARAPLAVGILQETTGRTIGFLPWMLAAGPTVVVLMGVGLLVLLRFFPSELGEVEVAERFLSEKAQALGPLTRREKGIGALMIVTIFCWVTLGDRLGLANIALAAVVIAFIFQLMTWKEVEEDVNWGVFLLYGGAIAMGFALERTGAASWVARHTLGGFIHSPVLMVAALALSTIVLTEMMSNSAVVASLMPVAVGLARDIALDPRLLTLALAIPSGLAFTLPLSTPAMMLAYSSGFVRLRDVIKGGLLLDLIAWAVFCLLAVSYWPWIGLEL